jgi:hypothetical protein
VPATDVTFIDFRCLQNWTELQNLILTRSENIYNYYSITQGQFFCKLNYPRVWVLIGSLLKLETKYFFNLSIYFIILIYILIFLIYIKQYKSIYLIYFFFSGSSLLLIQRGNVDLIIFILLSLVALVGNKIFKSILFIFSVILKLYPFFGILYFLDNKRENILTFIILLIVSLIYFALSYNDIYYIIKNTPNTGDMSFGVDSIKLNIQKHFNYSLNSLLISISLILFILVVYFKLFKNFLFNEKIINKKCFLMGSSIFISIFLLGSHFDYRLILIFFMVPTIVNFNNKLLKSSLLILIFLSVELHRLVHYFGFFGGLLNSAAKLVFFILISLITLEILLKKTVLQNKYIKF